MLMTGHISLCFYLVTGRINSEETETLIYRQKNEALPNYRLGWDQTRDYCWLLTGETSLSSGRNYKYAPCLSTERKTCIVCMTYLALTEILSYKVLRGQTPSVSLTHTQTTHGTSCRSCSVRQTHGKDVAMRWVTGSVLYLWIFLMLHGSENRDTTVRTKKTRASQSSLSASQSKQQWNFGRLDFFKTKASIEEKTGRGGVGVLEWAGVRLGVMRRATPGVKCALPEELQPCQEPWEEIILPFSPN